MLCTPTHKLIAGRGFLCSESLKPSSGVEIQRLLRTCLGTSSQFDADFTLSLINCESPPRLEVDQSHMKVLHFSIPIHQLYLNFSDCYPDFTCPKFCPQHKVDGLLR